MLAGQGTCILVHTLAIFTVFLIPHACYIESHETKTFTYIAGNWRDQGHGVDQEGVEDADAFQYGISDTASCEGQSQDVEQAQNG